MAQQISVDITVNGKNISPFSHLSLRQAFNAHHYFEVRFNHDVLEEKGAVILNQSQAYLGKAINISFNDHLKTGTENIFKGVITDIRISNTLASPGDLIFSGYSSTILLETGETNLSHLSRSLNQIIKDTSGHVASNDLTINIAPVKKSPIPYVVQYRESNFAFIRRLAAEYGEQFFYDGSRLNFGKPAQAPSISLQYPHDISDLNLQMRLAPVGFEQVGYLSKEDKQLKTASSGQQVSGLDAFGKKALSTSEQVFQFKSNTLSRRKFADAKELDESVKMAKSNSAANLVVLHASTDSPFIKVGGSVHVTADTTDYGTFTVVSVNHQTDGFGNYHNEFEAIPSTVAVTPNPYDRKPVAEAQIGIVTDNKDPDNLGKVKVKLLWQKDNATTPYIRVLSPHGGVYGSGKKTRGQFFTPEINEHVIVGFTQNDPDRPFVMGSLPHGKAIDSAPNSDNHIKSISTRSGNIITFLDKEKTKEQEIHIQTDDTNYISIHLKEKDGTIKIYSSKAIEVDAKESISVRSGKTIHVKSENITVEASDSISIKANKKIEMKATDIKIDGSKSFEAKGGSTAKVSSIQTEISGSATAKVSGAKLDLEGGAVANLKAAIVKIN